VIIQRRTLTVRTNNYYKQLQLRQILLLADSADSRFAYVRRLQTLII